MAGLCSCFAYPRAFVAVCGGRWEAACAVVVAGLRGVGDTDASRGVIHASVAIVVFAVTLGFFGFVVGVGRVVADPPAVLTGLSCTAAYAALFAAQNRREVVVDLPVAIVIDPVALFGLVRDGSDTSGPLAVLAGLRSRFAGKRAVVAASALGAALCSGITGLGRSVCANASAVFVRLVVAIVVFAVAFGFDSFVVGVGCVVCGCAIDPCSFHAGLLGAVADAFLVATGFGGEVVVDGTVAVVVFSVAVFRGRNLCIAVPPCTVATRFFSDAAFG